MAKLKTLAERTRDNDWPTPATFKSPEECEAAYNDGYIGCIPDPDGAEEIEAQQYGKFSDVAHEFGIADSGKGKLSLLYPLVWKVSGRDDWFQGSKSQPTGDCVSRGQSHAAIQSLAAAVHNGNGSWPDIPDAAYKTGMPFHPTPTYWNKKGGASGWSCSSAAARSKDKIGLAFSINYGGDIGDLTQYTTKLIEKYCRTGPPQSVIDELNGNVTLTYSRIKSFEEIRDAIANGYGVNSCGGQGFSKSRDANGVAKRSGSWSHSMAYVGVDDSDWASSNYGGPLVCVLNSWGTSWIKGPRAVQGKSDLPEIPKGAFWARWKDLSGRDCYAMSAVKGFPPQKLPSWNLRSLI